MGFQTPSSNKGDKSPHQKSPNEKLNAFEIWNIYNLNFKTKF